MRSEETGRVETAFEEIRRRGQQAIDAGLLQEAVEILQTAVDLAIQQGDPRLIDTTICNRAAAMIEMGAGESELPRLREILVRNSDPVNCRIAAYTIARHYEFTKNYKKALFYARITLGRSEQLDRRDWLASSHNLIGNTLLAESFIEEACKQYENALELISGEPTPARAKILHNIGYCRTLQKRYTECYRLLYESLAIMKRFGVRRHEVLVRRDLCFAHLETQRYRLARLQGSKALALAESIGDHTEVKHTLYLLGEVENLSGNIETARGYFSRLQQEFFPGQSYLPEFLLAVDIRTLVNLHA
jgi:tetratricopeptide (TPR) repeat protein